MEQSDTVIATFKNHEDAETAVKKLASVGFEMKALSVVGKGFHTEEKIVGFYNTSDRVKFWGSQGAFWGGLWGLFLGGLYLTSPVVGPVVVLGYLAVAAASYLEGAVTLGVIGALSGALFSLGIPKDSVLQYEAAIKADGFLVMAHGTASDMARAKTILGTTGASHVDTHIGSATAEPANVIALGNA